MKYIIQSLWILYFYALGIGISFLLNGLIPASVVGMILLFTALSTGIIKENRVEDVSKFLLKYMILFFIPASVGVMVVWQTVASNLWAILISAGISTILVIAVVGLTQQKIGKRW